MKNRILKIAQQNFVGTNTIGNIIPIHYDNTQSWKLRNKGRGAFFGNFILNEGGQVVVRLNGQDIKIDKNYTKEVLFEELISIGGMVQLVSPHIYIKSNNLFNANEYLKFKFTVATGTLQVTLLDDTVIHTSQYTKQGEIVDVVDGAYSFEYEVLKIPTEDVVEVLDSRNGMYEYIPAFEGNETTYDKNKVLENIRFTMEQNNFYCLVVGGGNISVVDVNDYEVLNVPNVAGGYSFRDGFMEVVDSLEDGTYYVDSNSYLYEYTEGTDPQNGTEKIKVLFDYIQFQHDYDNAVFKCVTDENTITLCVLENSNWNVILSTAKTTGTIGVYNIVKIPEIGVKYFDEDFYLLENKGENIEPVNKLPFSSISIVGEKDYYTIGLMYSAYDYPNYYYFDGENKVDLGLLDNDNTVIHVDGLDGGNTVVDILNSEDNPDNRAGVISLLEQYFEFEKNHGEVICEFDVLSDGTLINVLTEAGEHTEEKEVQKVLTQPIITVKKWNLITGSIAKIVIIPDGDNLDITLFDPITKEQINSMLMPYDGEWMETKDFRVELIEPFDMLSDPDLAGGVEYYINKDSKMFSFIPVGSGSENVKFDYGQLNIDQSLFDNSDYGKLIFKITRNLNGILATEIQEFDLAKLDYATGLSNSLLTGVNEKYTFLANDKVNTLAVGQAKEFVIDKDLNLYSFTGDSSIIQTEKTFTGISAIFDVDYEGDKIIKLEVNRAGDIVVINAFLDEDVLGVLNSDSGQFTTDDGMGNSITLEDVSAFSEGVNVIYLNGDLTMMLKQPGYTIPAQKVDIENNNGIKIKDIDFTGVVGTRILIDLYYTGNPNEIRVFVYDIQGSANYVIIDKNIKINDGTDFVCDYFTIEFLEGFSLDMLPYQLVIDSEGTLYDYQAIIQETFDTFNVKVLADTLDEPIWLNLRQSSGELRMVWQNFDGTKYYYNHSPDNNVSIGDANLTLGFPDVGEIAYTDINGIYFDGKFYHIDQSGNQHNEFEGVGTVDDCIIVIKQMGAMTHWYYTIPGDKASQVKVATKATGYPAETEFPFMGTWLIHEEMGQLTDGIYYVKSGGQAYKAIMGGPMFNELLGEHQENGFLMTDPVNVPDNYVPRLYTVREFNGVPVFEMLMTDGDFSGTPQFVPIMEMQEVTITDSEFTWEPVYIGAEIDDFDFIWIDNPNIVDGVPDTYEPIMIEVTEMIGATDEEINPLDEMGNISIFQFNGHYLEFD